MKYFLKILISLYTCLHSVCSYRVKTEESCLLTMTIPKEKIKNTCQVEENLKKRMRSLESRLSQFRDQLTQQQIHLINQNKKIDASYQKFSKMTNELQDKAIKNLNCNNSKFWKALLCDKRDGEQRLRGLKGESDDVNNRQDNGAAMKRERVSRQHPAIHGMNINVFDLLRPYVDVQITKLRKELSKKIDKEIKPVSHSFKIVNEAATSPLNKYAASFGHRWSAGKLSVHQLHTNTLALGKVLPELTRVHERIYNLKENDKSLNEEFSKLKQGILDELQKAKTDKQTLELRVAELEGENRMLKLNKSLSYELGTVYDELRVKINQLEQKMQNNFTRASERSRISKHESEMTNTTKLFDRIDNLNAKYDSLFKDVSHLDSNLQNNTVWINCVENSIGLALERKDISIESNISCQSTVYKTVKFVDSYRNDKKITNRQLIDIYNRLEHLNRSLNSIMSHVKDINIIKNISKMNYETLNSTLNRYKHSITGKVTELKNIFIMNKKHFNRFQNRLLLINRTNQEMLFDIKRLRNLVHRNMSTTNKHLNKLQLFQNYLHDKDVNMSKDFIYYKKSVNAQMKSVKTKLKKQSNLNNTIRTLSDKLFVVERTMQNIDYSLKTRSTERLLTKWDWVPYKFRSNDGHNKCGGKRYVRRAQVPDSNLIVGVVLCSRTKYKIFLSYSLDGQFLDVGDSDGFGEEHCELVGGASLQKKGSEYDRIPMFTTPIMGFQMDNTGDIPKKKYLTFIHNSPNWYHCNVTIP